MEISKILIILTLLLGILTCENSNNFDKNPVYENINIELDSVFLKRVDKPDWIDLGEYPEEKIVISLTDGNFFLRRNAINFKQGYLKDKELMILDSLLSDLSVNYVNRIYNTSAPWLIDLELYAYARDSEYNFMIKSFGQHGENPDAVIALYSFLLQKMRNEFKSVIPNAPDGRRVQ